MAEQQALEDIFVADDRPREVGGMLVDWFPDEEHQESEPDQGNDTTSFESQIHQLLLGDE